MEDQRGGLARWFLLYGDTVYLTAAGLLLLAASWGAISKGSDAAAASFAVLSGGALLVAPFASRLHGVLRIGPIGMSLREKVIVAAAVAPSRSLEGVLPLLVSNDI